MNISQSGFSSLPEVVKNLLIINGLAFLATIVFKSSFDIDLNNMLGLHYWKSEHFRIYQVVTYMFMHGSISHLLFNMFAVWMFGTTIENTWGPKRFLTYYLLTGFGAAALHYGIIHFQLAPDIAMMESIILDPSLASIDVFIDNHRFQVSELYSPEIYPAYEDFKSTYSALNRNPENFEALNMASRFFSQYLTHFMNQPPVVGASGSLFGILLAFGMLFPNALLMMLFIPVPIKAKYFVMAYGAIELFQAIANKPGDNVAHFAHLGGMIFGFILIKIWGNKKIF